MQNWIRLSEDNIAEAFGPAASHLLLNHRKDLDSLVRGWHQQDKLNKVLKQVQYVRNSHWLVDSDGHVRAAGRRAHCEHYMQAGYTVVIRESLEAGCTCQNNADYCESCVVNV